MNLTFLGHQSWLISEDNTNILIDPVLSDKFGYDTIHGIEIYPPRSIEIDKMPKVDGIILSHEHSDHFHLPTLLAFKKTPIYCTKLMPSCVTKLIHEAGLTVYELNFQEPFRIGEIEFVLYPPDADTVFWESRVAQVHLQSLVHINASVFVAVDALVSSKYKEDIEEEILNHPSAVIVSNNSQIPPKGVNGALDNCRVSSLNINLGIVGLQILTEILITYLEGLEGVDNLIICGGGFTKSYDTFFGPYQFSDQHELAKIAQLLSINKNIYGPLPGDIIMIEDVVSSAGRQDWVKINQARFEELNELGRRFKLKPKSIPIQSLLGQFDCENEFAIARQTLESELPMLARAFMLSTVGELAISTPCSDRDPNPGYKFLIRFLSQTYGRDLTYCLDFNQAKFILVNMVDDRHIPFGVELYLKDFISVLSGEIQIWDLAGIAMRSWYSGSKLHSPIAFLYSWYGEQVHTEKNYKCYMNRWEKILDNSLQEEVAV